MQISDDILVGKTTEHLAQVGAYAGVLHADAVAEFEQLVECAKVQGFDLRIISGFRSFERQLAIWNGKARGERPVLDDSDAVVDLSQLSELETIHTIMRFSALPGGSRHHWGSDFDVYDAAAITCDYQVQLVVAETEGAGLFSELHAWLNQELPKTNFYRPYEYDSGGVSREPWHLSFRPIAQPLSDVHNVDVMKSAWQGVELELAEAIKANIDDLFERFVRVA